MLPPDLVNRCLNHGLVKDNNQFAPFPEAQYELFGSRYHLREVLVDLSRRNGQPRLELVRQVTDSKFLNLSSVTQFVGVKAQGKISAARSSRANVLEMLAAPDGQICDCFGNNSVMDKVMMELKKKYSKEDSLMVLQESETNDSKSSFFDSRKKIIINLKLCINLK